MLCRVGVQKVIMLSGTSRVYRVVIRQDKNFIKQNLATELITIWQTILKQNYLTPMNGQKFLNRVVQNILYLPLNIMMDLLYGQTKKPIKPGALNGMPLMWGQKEICWVIFLKLCVKLRCMQACIILYTNGLTHCGKQIKINMLPIMCGRR